MEGFVSLYLSKKVSQINLFYLLVVVYVLMDKGSPRAPDRLPEAHDQSWVLPLPWGRFCFLSKNDHFVLKGKNIETFSCKHQALLALCKVTFNAAVVWFPSTAVWSTQFLGLENWENWWNLIVQSWLKWNNISVWIFFRAIIWNLILIRPFPRLSAKAAPTKEGWAQVIFCCWWWWRFVFNVCIVSNKSFFESWW